MDLRFQCRIYGESVGAWVDPSDKDCHWVDSAEDVMMDFFPGAMDNILGEKWTPTDREGAATTGDNPAEGVHKNYKFVYSFSIDDIEIEESSFPELLTGLLMVMYESCGFTRGEVRWGDKDGKEGLHADFTISK